MTDLISETHALDHMAPAAHRVALGTKLADLSTQFNALRAAVDRIYLKNTFLITAPTITIKAASSPTAKMSTALRVLVAGSFQAKAANTDLTAISGNLADTKTALWAWYIDSSGTLSISTKTADVASAALALAAKPAVPDNKVEIGYAIIGNATGATFQGGTTALDATGLTVAFVSNPAVAALAAADVDLLT